MWVPLQKIDAFGLQCGLCSGKVVHLKIQHGLNARVLGFVQVKPRAAKIKEGKLAKTIEMPEAEHVAIKHRRLFDVAHHPRHLV